MSKGVMAESEPGKLRACFVELLENLLGGVHEVFPECHETEDALRMFRLLVKGDAQREADVVKTCHAVFREHGDAIKARDPEALFRVAEDTDLLRGLRLREKWEDPEFEEASRENLWNYVTTLKSYAELHEAVPGKVLGKIERTAGELTEKLRRGELDLGTLDVAALGQAFSADFSEEELRQFESQLPQVLSSVAEVVGALGKTHDGPGLLGELSKTLAAKAGSGEMPALLQQLGSAGELQGLLRTMGGPGELQGLLRQLGGPGDIQGLMRQLGDASLQPPAKTTGKRRR